MEELGHFTEKEKQTKNIHEKKTQNGRPGFPTSGPRFIPSGLIFLWWPHGGAPGLGYGG